MKSWNGYLKSDCFRVSMLYWFRLCGISTIILRRHLSVRLRSDKCGHYLSGPKPRSVLKIHLVRASTCTMCELIWPRISWDRFSPTAGRRLSAWSNIHHRGRRLHDKYGDTTKLFPHFIRWLWNLANLIKRYKLWCHTFRIWNLSIFWYEKNYFQSKTPATRANTPNNVLHLSLERSV